MGNLDSEAIRQSSLHTCEGYRCGQLGLSLLCTAVSLCRTYSSYPTPGQGSSSVMAVPRVLRRCPEVHKKAPRQGISILTAKSHQPDWPLTEFSATHKVSRTRLYGIMIMRYWWCSNSWILSACRMVASVVGPLHVSLNTPSLRRFLSYLTLEEGQSESFSSHPKTTQSEKESQPRAQALDYRA